MRNPQHIFVGLRSESDTKEFQIENLELRSSFCSDLEARVQIIVDCSTRKSSTNQTLSLAEKSLLCKTIPEQHRIIVSQIPVAGESSENVRLSSLLSESYVFNSSSVRADHTALQWNIAAYLDSFHSHLYTLKLEECSNSSCTSHDLADDEKIRCILFSGQPLRATIQPILIEWNSISLGLHTLLLVIRRGFSIVHELHRSTFEILSLESRDTIAMNDQNVGHAAESKSRADASEHRESPLAGSERGDSCSRSCFANDSRPAEHPFALVSGNVDPHAANQLNWTDEKEINVTLVVAAINAGRPSHYGKGDSSFEGDYLWSLKQVSGRIRPEVIVFRVPTTSWKSRPAH